MFDTHVTVVGNVVAEPRLAHTKDGHAVASFRVASTPRRLDRLTGEWRDGETLFTGVTCWRALAENVYISLKKGSSVIVMGKLSIRPYETKDGDKRQSVDIDALAVGPDLGRAVAVIKRAERGGPPLNAMERSAGDLVQPEEPEESDDAEPGTSYPNAASTPAISEHEWDWSHSAGQVNPEGGDQVGDEVAPDAAEALAPEPEAAEPLAAESLAGAGVGGGGRWRRGVS
ncbi:MAG TPA: single-stranded DNA-binding protein [Acidothermaceae bacterium]